MKKGKFVMVDGELLIENRETANGRVTYVTINAAKVQFPPVQYVNSREPGQASEAPEPAKPASAADQKPDYFNPARFDDE